MGDFLAYELLPVILNMTLTASVVIVLVLLVRLALRRAPRVCSYALWLVVLFRLLCPVSVTANISLMGLLDTPVTEVTAHTSAASYVPRDVVHDPAPAVDLPVPGIGEAVTDALPQGEEQAVADPLEAPMAIATIIWMAGVAAMGIWGAVSLVRLRRRLVGAVILERGVYLADHIDTHFVLGLFRPKIYLPSALPEGERGYILLHERHHIRRLDHAVKLLAFLALCIHWFNPLVWLMFVLLGRDMEMSCDEAVMKKLGEAVRADYSASLLRLATGRKIIAGAPLAFGEGNTRDRVVNVLKWKRPRLWAVLAGAAVCAVVIAACAVNPGAAAEDERPSDGGMPVAETTAPQDESTSDSAAPNTQPAAAGEPEAGSAVGNGGQAAPTEAQIHASILTGCASAGSDAGLSFPFRAEAHLIWDQTLTADSCTVYAWVYYAVYDWSNGEIVSVLGKVAPAAVTFAWEDGWQISGFWMAADDASEAEIRSALPARIASLALGPHDSAETAELNERCMAAARQYYAAQTDLPPAGTFSAEDVEFTALALSAMADDMTYEERLAWASAGTAGDIVSCGDWRESGGALAYTSELVGTSHTGQYFLTLRFADGTAADLPLPKASATAAAYPDRMEFDNGSFIYEITFSDQATANQGETILHLAGTYRYEVDLTAKTVSLSITG